MADADVLTLLSVQDGAPQYLLLARKSPYARLADQFPLYEKLEELAGDARNQTILTRDQLQTDVSESVIRVCRLSEPGGSEWNL